MYYILWVEEYHEQAVCRSTWLPMAARSTRSECEMYAKQREQIYAGKRWKVMREDYVPEPFSGYPTQRIQL